MCAESVSYAAAVWGDIMIVDDGWMDRESGVSMKRGCDSEIVYTVCEEGIADLMVDSEKGEKGTCNSDRCTFAGHRR